MSKPKSIQNSLDNFSKFTLLKCVCVNKENALCFCCCFKRTKCCINI